MLGTVLETSNTDITLSVQIVCSPNPFCLPSTPEM